MTFGHRGGNHPVKDLEAGRCFITSQNHGYVVDGDSVDPAVASVSHVNVNDNTVEGLNYRRPNCFTVQFHPEAAPGPRDTESLFDRFVDMMAHRPARLFGVKDRGFIRSGYYADMIVVNPDAETEVTKESLLYKCGWSPLEGTVFSHRIEQVFVNGALAYEQTPDGYVFHPHQVYPLRFI